MRKQSILLIILFCLSILKLSAQDWTFACTNKDGKEKYYIKSAAISSTGGIIKVWTKSNMPKYINKQNGKTYSNVESKILYEFDCGERKMQLLSALIYNSSGGIIVSYEPKEYELEWKNVVPESIGELLLDKACELFNQ